MKENRRSPRIVLRVPLEIRAIEAVCEATTAVVNQHGALILAPVPYPVGTTLDLRNMETNLDARTCDLERRPRYQRRLQGRHRVHKARDELLDPGRRSDTLSPSAKCALPLSPASPIRVVSGAKRRSRQQGVFRLAGSHNPHLREP